MIKIHLHKLILAGFLSLLSFFYSKHLGLLEVSRRFRGLACSWERRGVSLRAMDMSNETNETDYMFLGKPFGRPSGVSLSTFDRFGFQKKRGLVDGACGCGWV